MKSWRAYHTLFWILVLSLGIATFGGLVAIITLAVGMTPWEIVVVKASAPPPVAADGTLQVSAVDQLCLRDSDCTAMTTHCNGCWCDEAVNAVHAWKYEEQLRSLCGSIPSNECRFLSFCSTPYPRCIARRCVLSGLPPLGEGEPQVFTTQEACEQQTGKPCGFQACDYIPPGKTFEETCGKNFKKGWIAS